MKHAIDQKHPELVNRKGVVFYHDNARQNVSLMTRQKLRELGWEVLSHPSYSLNKAPSGYHVYLSMANAIGGEKLASREACEKLAAREACEKLPSREACEKLESEFFAKKKGAFYERSFMKFLSRRKQIIEQDGEYLT